MEVVDGVWMLDEGEAGTVQELLELLDCIARGEYDKSLPILNSEGVKRLDEIRISFIELGAGVVIFD